MLDGIAFRPGTPEDEHYILNTWLETLRPEWPEMRTSDYFPWMRERIAMAAVNQGVRVVVAHHKDAPTVIWGFAVASIAPAALHFVYVRPAHRGQRLAKALCNQAWVGPESQVTITALTDPVRAYKKRHPEALRYIPL